MASPPSVGAALAWSIAQLGGPLVETDSNPTVTTTVASLLNGNGDRVGLVFVNLGTNDVYVSLDSGVSTSNGIKIAANGGNITMNVRDDFTIPTRQWYAVANGGSSAMFILELARFNVTGPVGGK